MELTPEGKRLVKYALTAKAWTLEKLATQSEIGISAVKTFNLGKNVSRITFVTLCKKLEVDWEIASGQAIAPSEAPNDRPSTQSPSQDDLFQQVKERCRQRILTQHSRMRLLSGEEIGVDQLYVDVWLLNRSPRTFQVSESKLLESFDLRNDRLGLGDRIKRNSGFKVANDNPKLVILGKPGAGKTTFLKHLAIDWCKGQFQPDLIAVLIEFRRIRDGQFELLAAIDQELGLENWHRIKGLKKQIANLKKQGSQLGQIEGLQQQLEAVPLQVLLKQGKLLVLMDGLDEVPTNVLLQTAQRQLQQVAGDYSSNRFILTCRTQIMGSMPDGFTSVEVADFSPEQINQFVQNWFIANGKSDSEATQQWETLDYAVSRNLALKELTVTPVLLSLMCWVLQDEGEMPSQVNWLYEKAIKLLLSKWNDAKQIEGWEVGNKIYRELSVESRESLLTEIAARKFENPENFVLFKQEEIAAHITQFLQLAKSEEGVRVLKSIEAQHGLLIERADELWSFSHLSFQEYFTLRWLTQLSSDQLAKKIIDNRWQGLVKQLVKSQQPADRLVFLIKRAIDQSISSELSFQEILVWVLQKSVSIKTIRKLPAIRAFYFALVHTHNLACTLTHSTPRTLDLDFDLYLTLAHSSACTLDQTLDRTLDRTVIHGITHNLASAFSLSFCLACDRNYGFELANRLKQSKTELPEFMADGEFQEWWQSNGTQWIAEFRRVMIQHRNIGHDWQLTPDQTKQLQRYNDANRFLVDLINIEGAITNRVRAEIEDSLLLPWEELQRRHPQTYGQSQSS